MSPRTDRHWTQCSSNAKTVEDLYIAIASRLRDIETHVAGQEQEYSRVGARHLDRCRIKLDTLHRQLDSLDVNAPDLEGASLQYYLKLGERAGRETVKGRALTDFFNSRTRLQAASTALQAAQHAHDVAQAEHSKRSSRLEEIEGEISELDTWLSEHAGDRIDII